MAVIAVKLGLTRDGLVALCPERLKPCDELTPALLFDRSFGR